MINTSDAYKEAVKANRIMHHKAEIAFADGTTITAEDSDMFTFQIVDNTSNTNSFDLGSAIVQQLNLKLDNLDGKYTDHDFNNAVITVSVGLEVNDGTEWLEKGKFTAEPGEISGDMISVTAFDNMLKFDQPYSISNLIYPTTLGSIVRDACSCCDVALAVDSASFDNDDFVVNARPDDSVTFRQILQWVGQIACKYSKFNTAGQLSLRWYDIETLESTWIRQAGGSSETLCAGNSNLVDVDASSIIKVTDLLSGSTITTEDVVITGVKVTEESVSGNTDDDMEYQSGSDGYILTVSGNKLIQDGKGATVASYLGERLNGLRFRPLSVKCPGDPAREAGDLGLVTDRKGNNYKTILTGATYTAHTSQDLICGAESPVRLSATRYSEATQVYRNLREVLSKQRSEWEKAYEDLQEAMNDKTGLYPITETLEDGSSVLYFCNKPTLEESQVIVEFNAKGWGMSTNGGESWNIGALVDGTMITQILNTIGVNADWIRTGALTVTDNDGNVIFSVDMDTKQVIMSGDSIRIGGKTVTAAINDVLQESKDYSDGKLADFADTVTENITGLQAQIDGQIETFYEDYEPSLQNYPASEWTTTEERKKHEGDLFYWKSKGYAYRFFQDGSTWKWQLVQDTDITQAMAAAEKAQDTADGKRRVFVVTPQPPYDIGDLWCNGADILTCAVARAQGSVFVSSDWEKLNNYTDDTVANEALEEAKKARNLNMILDNEYQGIPADAEGNIDSFPVVQTGVQVFYGNTDVSVDCSYSIVKSDSVTGNWDNIRRVYTVTGLAADTGWVDITASYLSLFSITKRFNVQKIKDGAPGEDGKPARMYTLESSASIIKRVQGNLLIPNNIIFQSFCWEGEERKAYAGRFKIEETVDGNIWETLYISEADETEIRHELYSAISTAAGRPICTAGNKYIAVPRKMNQIRCTLYASGGTTNIIDVMTITAVKDVEALTQDEIFNLLTNNGEVKGIYKEGNQLYISFTYAKGGVLGLGGLNNGNGVLQVFDNQGNLKAQLDMVSFNVNGGNIVLNMDGSFIARKATIYGNGEFSGNLSAAGGTFKGDLQAAGGTFSGNLSAAGGTFKGNLTAEAGGVIGGWQINNGRKAIVSPNGGITLDAQNNRIITAADTTYGSPSIISANESRFSSVVVENQFSHPGGGVYFESGSTSEIKFYNAFSDGSGGSGATDRIYLNGSLRVSGSKNRVVSTKNYGKRLQYCYEMASPVFGDLGEAEVDDIGICYIFLDDVFAETINSGIEYQVFLQKEGQGEVWVHEKEKEYFVVKGTPGLKFSWEIKARQKDFEMDRLENSENEDLEIETIDYLRQGQNIFMNYCLRKEII